MNQVEVLDALNKVNVQLTQVQKLVVGTINKIQQEGLPHQVNIGQLITTYADAVGLMQPLTDKLNSALTHITNAKLQADAQSKTPDTIDREQISMPGRARRRLAEAGETLALDMLAEKIGPAFVEKLQQRRATKLQEGAQAEMPTLVSTPRGEPVAAEAIPETPTLHAVKPAGTTEPDLQLLKREEELRTRLLTLVFEPNGVLARWFSEKTYQGGRGVMQPEANRNHYTNDISLLPYDRLMQWPEGFYTNKDTSAPQYLLKTSALVAVIDFGLLTNEDEAVRRRSLQVCFHTDETHRKLLISHLENKLIESVVRDMNDTLTAQWNARQTT